MKTLLPLALALCSPVFAAEPAVVAPTEFVTSFSVMVYGFFPPTPISGSGTWSDLVTLEATYDSEAFCQQQVKALILMIEALKARGIDLVDGVACAPVPAP